MVRPVPTPLIVPPPPVADVFAARSPAASLSATVNDSPLVAPLSDRLTPEIAVT